MALYSGYYSAVPTKPVKRDPPKSRPSTASPRANQPSNPSSEQLSSASVAQFLDPAVDGPPSPEKLRQLNRQMKRVSRLHRQHGHRAASSESSSLTSTTGSDRPQWELALDNLSLVRRTSIRSNESSTPSRDRPDSIHNFGKNLFHRRGKSKRESSSHSSSASSIYSADVPVDGGPTGPKESIIPAIFSRRKPPRDDAPQQQKRPQISGPFNFQHVAHKQRGNHAADVQPGGRMEATTELLAMHPNGPTSAPGVVNPTEIGAYHPSNLSSESLDGQYDDFYDTGVPRPPLVPRHTAPASGPRRLMKHARSQDQFQRSPPRAPTRPPRSPIQSHNSSPFPPIPPPRISSRQSNHHQEVYDAVVSAIADRPQTSGGFRRPQPFSPFGSTERLPQSAVYYDATSIPEDEASSAVLDGAHDVAWPLPSPIAASYETALPDVPEEEEHYGFSRRSRLSLVSINSSLRGSQSVPMLRSTAESQRPMSGASETLGPFDASAARQATDTGTQDKDKPELLAFRESWEDDIDYCYNHEAEADCDYQWERPSMDTARDDDPTPVPMAYEGLAEMRPSRLAQASPGMLSPAPHDVPALSPASQTSIGIGHEAVTPTTNTTVASNFSFPRGDRKSLRPLDVKDGRRTSGASSFKESQGFTLSPSLLIPCDYQQQMLLQETERKAYPEYDEYSGLYRQAAFYEDAMHLGNNSTPFHQRSSTSTTTTNSTSRSNSTGKRHMSTASSWTTLTRHTASSTSLNKMDNAWADEAEPLPTTNLADQTLVDMEPVSHCPSSRDVVPDLIPFPFTSGARKSHHKSHASESFVPDEVPPLKSLDTSKPWRQRARTTSLGTQAPPPVGQYALFPRAYVKGIGDQI